MKIFMRKRVLPNSKPNNIVTISYVLLGLISYVQIYWNKVAVAVELPENAKAPAIYVFGDSIVDPGNNNYINTIGRANFPPYGRDFKGGVPTGRYSNGKVPSDLLAEKLGIKEFVPPYLDPSLKISDLLTGVSFASGASGFDPISSMSANSLSLEEQLKLFKEYIKKLKGEVGENTTSTIISQSFYLVCAGSNDITNTYFALPIRKLQYSISSYNDMLIQYATSFVLELYETGARRICLTNLPPCGCLPSQRTLYGGVSRDCMAKENEAASDFNNKLSSALTSLGQKLTGSDIVILDIYTPLLKLILNPSRYGFDVSNRGCCGTGNIEVSFLCTEYDSGTCKDASKYVFWDSFHPTQAAYTFLVDDLTRHGLNHFLS